MRHVSLVCRLHREYIVVVVLWVCLFVVVFWGGGAGFCSCRFVLFRFCSCLFLSFFVFFFFFFFLVLSVCLVLFVNCFL